MPRNTNLFPEWLTSNSVRAYPVAETASRLDASTGKTIPDALVLDARISIPYEMRFDMFYVSQIDTSPTRASVTISRWDIDDEESSRVTTIFVSTEEDSPVVHEYGKTYLFTGATTLDDTSNYPIIGQITLGNLMDAFHQSPGVSNFNQLSGRLEMSILNISFPCVDYLAVMEEGALTQLMTSGIQLVAGDNIRLTPSGEGTEEDPFTIRIDAIPGENMTDCGELPGEPIYTINGIGPDADGNFEIRGSECIEIGTTMDDEAETILSNGIVIKDLCATSCCGCEELNSILTAISALESRQQQLADAIARTHSEQTLMIANITSSMRR